jgi:hypothetical protein
MDLQKVASQRANTGARLRVIRELAGIPESFTEKELEKPLYFGRMIQNTDYILKTKEGRLLATAKALGVDVASLFGARGLALAHDAETPTPVDDAETTFIPRSESNGSETPPAAGQNADESMPEFPDDEPQDGEQAEFERLTAVLDQYMTYKEALDVPTSKGNPYEIARKELDSETATVESRGKMIERVRGFLIARHVRGVA